MLVSEHCVAESLCQVAPIQHQQRQSWNCHHIPGRTGGIPDHLRRNYHLLARIPSHAVPSTEHAAMQFEQDGGHLTRGSYFGTDPLSGYDHLQMLRERDFRCTYPSCSKVFENVIKGCLLMQFYLLSI